MVNEATPAKAVGEIARRQVKDSKGAVLVKAGEKITDAAAKKLDKAGVEAVPVKARVTKEVVYLDAFDEERAVIAPANTKVQEDGYFAESVFSARGIGGEAAELSADDVNYVDISSQQIVGVSAALIPFMEHDVECIGVVNGLGKAILHCRIFCWRQFFLKGAEHHVPDNQKHTHVAIEVQGIVGMMHPMVGRRY